MSTICFIHTTREFRRWTLVMDQIISLSLNKKEKHTRFLLAPIPNKKQEGASIYLYEGGLKNDEHFNIPPKPEKPTACDRTDNSDCGEAGISKWKRRGCHSPKDQTIG